MLHYSRFLSVFVCVLLMSDPVSGQPAGPLVFYTEDLAPYNMIEDGRVTGISSEILAVALNRLEIGFAPRLVSWKRAYHEAQVEPHSCVYSTVRSPEREPLFQWVGPIARDSLAVFVLPESKLQGRTLEDLKGYRTVVSQGDYAEARLRETGIILVPAPPAERQMDMMLRGRIDFWVSNHSEAQSEAKRSGVALRELFSYEDFELYLACNRGVSTELIGRMDAAVKQLWDSGEAARITAKFMSGSRE